MEDGKKARESRTISFGLSLRELEALDRLREREGGLNRSAMIRRLIRIEAKSKSLWAIDDRAASVVDAKSALFG